MVSYNIQAAITRIGVFLLFSSLFFLISCGGSGPCDGGPQGSCSQYVKSIDTFYLDSNIFKALPDKIKSQLIFKNNNGYRSIFNMKESGIRKLTQGGNLTYVSVSVECGSLSCYNYFLNQYCSFSYQSADLPFSFGYILSNVSTTNSYKYAIDSNLTGYSAASIYINNIGFNLPFNRPVDKNSRLLDSLTINNKSYYNVNQIYLDSASIDNTVIKPIGIFYTETNGLIGFYLTNGETWGLSD